MPPLQDPSKPHHHSSPVDAASLLSSQATQLFTPRRGKRTEPFGPSIVMKKWLNIKPKVYDFSEDETDIESEDDACSLKEEGKHDDHVDSTHGYQSLCSSKTARRINHFNNLRWLYWYPKMSATDLYCSVDYVKGVDGGLSRRLRGQVLRCHPRLGQIRLSLEPQERSCNALSPLILKIHEIELEVRDYKLDQYDLHDGVARAGDVLALTDLSLKFIASLRSGDRFILKVVLVR
ncbi:hypothetical protein CASFOL_025095 [Castilleja foliolosa]|uniref:Uncharacterized protein n=1 Tax=Castilleja foliolosa TaxID=1961234 RepID=A0ABD3CTD5_9LAMI